MDAATVEFNLSNDHERLIACGVAVRVYKLLSCMRQRLASLSTIPAMLLENQVHKIQNGNYGFYIIKRKPEGARWAACLLWLHCAA